MKNAYILVGPPGAGKGTQAELLDEELDIKLIQPGVFLRKEAEKDTDVGVLIRKFLAHGLIVPNQIVDKKVFQVLKKVKKDVLFDGYPRTIPQAEKLYEFLTEKKVKINFVMISLQDSLIMERINGRRSCSCGETFHIKYNPPKKKGVCDKCDKKLFIRSDSKKNIVKKRIELYKKETAPVIKFFKKKKRVNFVKINGAKPIEKVHQDILVIFNDNGKD